MGLMSVDALARAVELAEDQAARVVVVRHELDALLERGSIATVERADTQRALPAHPIFPLPEQARAGGQHQEAVLVAASGNRRLGVANA
jgi:hypothetical protein